jgi:hypothetical protein
MALSLIEMLRRCLRQASPKRFKAPNSKTYK